MNLVEALKKSLHLHRKDWDFTISHRDGKFFNERTQLQYVLTPNDCLENDWVAVTKQEAKEDKVLAAELLIKLMKELTEEISKSNKAVMDKLEEINSKIPQQYTISPFTIPYTPNPPFYPTVTYIDSSNGAGVVGGNEIL